MYVSAGHFGVFFFAFFFYIHTASFRVGGVRGVSIFMTPTRLGRVEGERDSFTSRISKSPPREHVFKPSFKNILCVKVHHFPTSELAGVSFKKSFRETIDLAPFGFWGSTHTHTHMFFPSFLFPPAPPCFNLAQLESSFELGQVREGNLTRQQPTLKKKNYSLACSCQQLPTKTHL